VMFSPAAKVYHWGGTSTSRQGVWSRYHYRRSQLYFYWKHNSPLAVVLLRLYLGLLIGWLKGRAFLGREENQEVISAFSQLLKERFDHEK